MEFTDYTYILRDFNPRTPYRVRRVIGLCGRNSLFISIHALHTECDMSPMIVAICTSLFQSTHSIQSATEWQTNKKPSQHKFQSTHSIQSATGEFYPCKPDIFISIHALHTECDYNDDNVLVTLDSFQSTHSIQSATSNIFKVLHIIRFQSTHSIQSATHTPAQFLHHDLFQSTHSIQSATQLSVP